MTQTVMQKPIVIAAGGTGGHMFPAQSLAQKLMERGHAVVLITDDRGLKFADGFDGARVLEAPSGTPSAAGVVGKLRAVLNIVRGTVFSLKTFRQIKPQLIVGFGGYPSLPPLLAGLLFNVPLSIHEQNAVLGRVNRLIAPFVKKIATSFPSVKMMTPRQVNKIVFTGNPVRKEILEQRDVSYHAPDRTGEFRILVTGGSQGARIFSDMVPVALTVLPLKIRGRISLVQQCRPEDLKRVEKFYKTAGLGGVRLETFIGDMSKQMAKAHLVMSRSGASTVAELCAIGRPAILSPLPYAVDNHQFYNAKALEEAGGGWVLQDRDMSPVQLAQMIRGIMRHTEDLNNRADIMRDAAPVDAADRLADMVDDLLNEPAQTHLLVKQEGLA